MPQISVQNAAATIIASGDIPVHFDFDSAALSDDEADALAQSYLEVLDQIRDGEARALWDYGLVSAERAASATLAPSAAASTPSLRPMPGPTPVTMTTLSFSSMSFLPKSSLRAEQSRAKCRRVGLTALDCFVATLLAMTA